MNHKNEIFEDQSLAGKISNWCVKNTMSTIFMGLVFITIGLFIHEWGFNEPHNPSKEWWERIHWSTVFYHFFVILGEAVFVMFLLHIGVEKANHRAHQKATEKSLGELQITSVEILSDLKNRIEDVFGTMTAAFKKEGEETVKALKINLFAAILQEKMPIEMVDVVLKNEFFNTNFLRKKLVVEYVFQNIEANVLHIEQRIKFDIQYISGKDDIITYEMPFSLSDTPLASYVFVEASYKTQHGEDNGIYTKFTQDEHFLIKETGKNKEKDAFQLREAIRLSKNETINVEQVFSAKYILDDKGMYDSYHVNNHTIGATIIFDLPKVYEIGIYPTFPEKYLPASRDAGNRRIYENIKFLVPGQGFGFSIKKQ